MKITIRLSLILAALLIVWTGVAPTQARTQEKPAAQMPPMPNPGVPQIFSLEGRFVRAAYNNEGYIIMGYQTANRSVGGEWMLLDIGLTLLGKTPDYKLTRDKITIDTPDGQKIPLPSIIEHRAGNTQALDERAKVQRDSINYFPPEASQACRIGFFADLDSRAIAYNEVELSKDRACVGRIYFHVPGGIKVGQHWLNVQFEKSVVRAPFRILTEEEEKTYGKNFKEISKQVDEAFKKK